MTTGRCWLKWYRWSVRWLLGGVDWSGTDDLSDDYWEVLRGVDWSGSDDLSDDYWEVLIEVVEMICQMTTGRCWEVLIEVVEMICQMTTGRSLHTAGYVFCVTDGAGASRCTWGRPAAVPASSWTLLPGCRLLYPSHSLSVSHIIHLYFSNTIISHDDLISCVFSVLDLLWESPLVSSGH